MVNSFWEKILEVKEEILGQHRKITNQRDNLSDLGGEDEILHGELDMWISRAKEEGLTVEEAQELGEVLIEVNNFQH